MLYAHAVWKWLSECHIGCFSFLTNVSLPFPSLPPSLFLYRMVTSVALWTLCASSPIQRQNVWVLFLFSLSFCLFFFAPSLSQLTVSSLSEDHFIPNLHVYYNINNITKKWKQPSDTWIGLALSGVSDLLDAFDKVFICRTSIIIWKPWCNIQIQRSTFANSIKFSGFNVKTTLKIKVNFSLIAVFCAWWVQQTAAMVKPPL